MEAVRISSMLPDWVRRATRLAIALVIFTSAAATLWMLPAAQRSAWGEEVRQACIWGAATCAVVATSPLTGKVVQTSSERAAGTFAGGALGFVFFDFVVQNPAVPDDIETLLVCTAAALAGIVSTWASQRFGLDLSARLFVVSFVLVTFGARQEHGALPVAALRTGGIFAGVAVFTALQVAVLPKSASVEAIRESQRSVRLLARLNDAITDLGRCAAGLAGASAFDPLPSTTAGASSPQPVVSRAVLQPRLAVATGGGAGSRGLSGYVRLAGSEAEAEAAAPVGMSGGSKTPHLHITVPSADVHQRQQQQQQQQQQWRQQQLPSSPWVASPQPLLMPRAITAEARAGVSGRSKADPSVGDAMEKHEEEYEKTLSEIYTSVFKMKELLQLSRNELYVSSCWGHHFVLPLFCGGWLPGCLGRGAWQPPAEPLEALSTSVRRLSRLLYALHLNFEDLLSAESALPESLRLAPGLLLPVSRHLRGALAAVVEGYPSRRCIVVDELRAFATAVDELLGVSGAGREAIISQLTRGRARPRHPMRESAERQLRQEPFGPWHAGGGGGGDETMLPPDTASTGNSPRRGSLLTAALLRGVGSSGGNRRHTAPAAPFVTEDGSCLPCAVQEWLNPQGGEDGVEGEGLGRVGSPASSEGSRGGSGSARNQRSSMAVAKARGRQVQVSLLSAVMRRNSLSTANSCEIISARSGAPTTPFGLAHSPIFPCSLGDGVSGPGGACRSPSAWRAGSGSGAPAHPQPPPPPPQQQQQQQQHGPSTAAASGGSGGANITPPPAAADDGNARGGAASAADAAAEGAAALAGEVRLYSLQLVLDALVEELEELYLAAGRVMQELPHGL